jgi:hypothetical protein
MRPFEAIENGQRLPQLTLILYARFLEILFVNGFEFHSLLINITTTWVVLMLQIDFARI